MPAIYRPFGIREKRSRRTWFQDRPKSWFKTKRAVIVIKRRRFVMARKFHPNNIFSAPGWTSLDDRITIRLQPLTYCQRGYHLETFSITGYIYCDICASTVRIDEEQRKEWLAESRDINNRCNPPIDPDDDCPF